MIHHTRDSIKLMKKIMDVQDELDSIQVVILSFINFHYLHDFLNLKFFIKLE